LRMLSLSTLSNMAGNSVKISKRISQLPSAA
jgi:hypothetical protein